MAAFLCFFILAKRELCFILSSAACLASSYSFSTQGTQEENLPKKDLLAAAYFAVIPISLLPKKNNFSFCSSL